MLNKLLYSLFFSGMGLFSYLLLVNYMSKSSIIALIYTTITFNILGHTILRISAWLSKRSPLYFTDRRKIGVMYIGVALILLLINYGLMVTAKLIMGAENPFLLTAGLRIFIIVTFFELIIVNMLIINRSVVSALKLHQRTAYLQEESDKAKYIALQNQLNPHFLFNSLNTLIAEIEYDPQNAVSFTRDLSNVYRYVLQCQNSPLVTIRDEIEFMDSYIFLHQVRLGNCIKIDNSIAECEMEQKLPPLTLQLLVENVIKHNYIGVQKPMTITLSVEQSSLVVSNIINPKINDNSTGIGLQNLSNRCKLQTGNDIDVEIRDGIFTVKIPLTHD